MRAYGGWGGSVILIRHNFEHNILVSWVTPESIILNFTSITRQTLLEAPQPAWQAGEKFIGREKKSEEREGGRHAIAK